MQHTYNSISKTDVVICVCKERYTYEAQSCHLLLKLKDFRISEEMS